MGNVWLSTIVRAKRGRMSLREAAADAGLSYSTILRLEKRQPPDVRTLAALRAWTGISADELLDAAMNEINDQSA